MTEDDAIPSREAVNPRMHAIANGVAPDDLRLCWDVASRSVSLIELWRATKLMNPETRIKNEFEKHVTGDPLPLMIDWATAQYWEPMNLRALMQSDDLVFTSELVKLMKRIDRRLHKLRDGDRFRFALSGAKQ